MYGWGETKSTGLLLKYRVTLQIFIDWFFFLSGQRLTGLCLFLCRYRSWWDIKQGDDATGPQRRDVLTNQRGCRGKQNMCWRKERRRCMWCKDHTLMSTRNYSLWNYILSSLASCLTSPQPFVCRKTTGVHWFAKNMSVKSSLVWALKERNALRHSQHFLSTWLFIPSGYTKCLNFTQMWTGTDGVAQSSASQNSKAPFHQRPWRRHVFRGKVHCGKWPVWDFCGSNGHFLEANQDWIHQMESHPLSLCNARNPGSYNHFTTTKKSWAQGQCTNCMLTCSELLKSWNKDNEKDTCNSVFSPGIYLKTDYGYHRRLPLWLTVTLYVKLIVLPLTKLMWMNTMFFNAGLQTSLCPHCVTTAMK